MMEKTKMIERYEAETGQEMPTVNVYNLLEWYKSFSKWVEAKADAYDRLMSGVWHSGKERPTKNGWYCAVYSTNIISDDGISTHPGEDELRIVQFYTKRDVWSYWFTSTRGRLVECINVPKKWMAIPDGWEESK